MKQYAYSSWNQWPGVEIDFYEISDYSCLNGWTFGNLIANSHLLAEFMYDLWGTEVLLSNATKEMMQSWEHTEIYFPCTYGLAAMPLTYPAKPGEDQDEKLRRLVGHAGEDWGSTAEWVGYNQAYDFSFAVTMNSFMGLNCSMKDNDWAAN